VTMRNLTTALLIGMLGASHVHANDIMIAGHGAQPCAVLNANIREGEGWATNALTQGAMSWMQGFASGVNAMKSEAAKQYFDLSTISRDEQWAYVLDFCRRNPSQDFSHAVVQMIVHRLRLINGGPLVQ